MGSRVFVRLYDGELENETDDVVLTLPPPPLKWAGVLSTMVAAIDKADDEDDDEDPDDAIAKAAAAVPAERIAKARLFLLPSDVQGIVAELNARGLRGIRENDQFVVCLKGEDYQKHVEKSQAADSEATGAESGPLPTPPSSNTSASSISPAISLKINSVEQQYASTSGFQHGHSSFTSTMNTSTAAPSNGSAAAPGGMLGQGMKGSKRYRSISGKMAAIKSLGDKGLISADDRGHLKDLLLNNDSPQLQEALDHYNNTGDFQAVKAILVKELSNPSTKRNTGDWISETLINDITMNFHTNDPSDPQTHAGQYSSASQTGLPANPFMYQDAGSSSSGGYHHPTSAASIGYATSSHVNSSSPSSSPVGLDHHSTPVYPQQDQSSIMPPDPYNQPHLSQTTPSMYGGAAQINLPVRDPNSTNLRTYGSSPAQMMDMRYGGVQYPNQMSAGQMVPSPMYSNSSMGYANEMPQDYNRMGMNPYGMVPANTGGYNTMLYQQQQQQQQQQQYNMSRYPYGSSAGMVSGGGAGYEYYQPGYGGFDKTQLRNSGKWTTAPPMPSYPPACSKEEKKEKIAKWLKKRENRNWSNKPSYPVRHSIAKNRKRGEDGRFITKARLAEMALEEAANGGVPRPEGASEFEIEDYDHVSLATLPTPTSVP